MKRNSNFSIVVSALEAGVPVTINNLTYIIGEDENEKKYLSFKVIRQRIEDGVWHPTEEAYLAANVTFDQFYEICSKASPEEITTIASNTVLNKF